MAYKSKYIKTEIDGKPKILHLCSCNLCPLLLFDNNKRVVHCSKYHSITTDVIDNNVFSYSAMKNVSVPIKEILIPDWCGLPEDIFLMNKIGDVYVKTSHNGCKIVPDIYQNLVVTSSIYVDYDRDLIRLVSAPAKNKITFHNFHNSSLLPALPETTKTYKSLETCSCCGQLLENVDRKKNIGMCPKCWEENKNNDEIKHFAYVNNFRLKRNSTWTEEIHKKIKEIS